MEERRGGGVASSNENRMYFGSFGDPPQWRWLALHLSMLEEGPHSAWCSVPVEDERSSVRRVPWVGLLCIVRVFGYFSAGFFAIAEESG